MTDARLVTINQMILAVIFGVGFIGLLFALLFINPAPSPAVLTLATSVVSVIGTVVVMQNTHFFKNTTDPSGGSNVPSTTTIHAQTVYHSSGSAPVNGAAPPAGPAGPVS